MKKIFYLFAILLQLGHSAMADIVKFVHGSDERIQVLKKSDFRHSIVGLLLDTKSKATCTGTLIGPQHVLTSAHCVYDYDQKKWTEGLEFYPGLLSAPKKSDIKANFKRIFLLKNYLETKSAESDFALIELDNSLGQKIGWAGFKSLNASTVKSEALFNIEMIGYPGDKSLGTLWETTCEASIENEFWSYYCDTFYGMSGSAIFLKDSTESIIVGIHSWGSPEKNGGLLFNSQIYNLILQWRTFKKYSQNTFIYTKP